MNKIVFAVMAGVIFLFIAGCVQHVAVHPQKAEKEFAIDSALCEEKARAYALQRYGDLTPADEINYARRCMRELGWEYSYSWR